jgi:hypothetical protein
LYYNYQSQINTCLLLDEKSTHSFDGELASKKVPLTLAHLPNRPQRTTVKPNSDRKD